MNNNAIKLDNRIYDVLTMPAKSPNEAIATAVVYIDACRKKNGSASDAVMVKPGIYSVKVSYDAEYYNEEDYTYKFVKERL